MRCALSVVLFSSLLSVLPSAASAQEDVLMRDNDIRLAAHFALGVGGDADARSGALATSTSLDPTLGFGVRAEIPVLGYLALGGMFESRGFQPTASLFFSPERYWVFDFDAIVRVRYLFTVVEGAIILEPYLAVPHRLHPRQPPRRRRPLGAEDAWPGFNVGAMLGAYLHTSARLGVLLELGFRHHEAFTNNNDGSGVSLATNQFALNVGLSYLLDN
jgi:hypothetical protein